MVQLWWQLWPIQVGSRPRPRGSEKHWGLKQLWWQLWWQLSPAGLTGGGRSKAAAIDR